MFNLDVITNDSNAKHNLKWSYIPDHPYKILIIGGSGLGKTNALLNLIRKQNSGVLIDKIYLHPKYLNEPKYQLFIEKREEAGMGLNKPNSKAFIEYSNTVDDVYNILNDQNPLRKRKTLIVFDNMIADINTNKTFQAIIKDLFFRWRILNTSLVFITQSYFSVPKEVRFTHYLIMKIQNKRERQNIAINHSADIEYKGFMNIYWKCTSEPYSFFTIDNTLPADSPLHFRKNLLDSLWKWH